MATGTATNHWKLGLFVSAGFVAIITVTGWLGARRLQRESIDAYFYFDENVSGLEVGSPVQFRGVPMGKVTEIRAAPDRRHVEVRAGIYVGALEDLGLPIRETPREPEQGPFVPTDLRAQLSSSILTGQTFIQCDFFDAQRYDSPAYPFEVPWNTIHSVPSTIKSLEQGLLQVLDAFPTIAEEASATLSAIRDELDGMRLAELTADARSLVQSLDDRVRELEELPFLKRGAAAFAEGEQALARVRALAEGLEGADSDFQRLLASWRGAGEELEESLGASDLPLTFSKIRRLSDDAGEVTHELALLSQDARRDLESLRRTLDALSRLADLLERDPQALLLGREARPPLLPSDR